MGGKLSYGVVLPVITLLVSLCAGSIWLVRYISSQHRASTIVIVPTHVSAANQPLAVQRAAIAVPLIQLGGASPGSGKRSHHKKHSSTQPSNVAAPPGLLADTRLVNWIADLREKLVHGEKPAADDRVVLEEILQNTPLSCRDLIGTGNAIQAYCADDQITALFYAAADRQGHFELSRFAPGAHDARPILMAMNSTKHLLWDFVDRAGRPYLDTMCLLNEDLIHWIAPGDSQLNNERIHGYIGLAECLYTQGKIDKAIVATNSIDISTLNSEQRIAMARIRGLALFRAKNYVDALPLFQIMAQEGSPAYSNEGWKMVVATLAKSGDTAGANAAFDDWVRVRHPTADEATPIYRDITEN
jgi:hypothetical protein